MFYLKKFMVQCDMPDDELIMMSRQVKLIFSTDGYGKTIHAKTGEIELKLRIRYSCV